LFCKPADRLSFFVSDQNEVWVSGLEDGIVGNEGSNEWLLLKVFGGKELEVIGGCFLLDSWKSFVAFL